MLKLGIHMDISCSVMGLRIGLLAYILPFICPFFCLLRLNLCHCFLRMAFFFLFLSAGPRGAIGRAPDS